MGSLHALDYCSIDCYSFYFIVWLFVWCLLDVFHRFVICKSIFIYVSFNRSVLILILYVGYLMLLLMRVHPTLYVLFSFISTLIDCVAST